jgi:UDP-4-amino-4,6-dideoxy-N-acetyl-beta-L-altrosamine transaminase
MIPYARPDIDEADIEAVVGVLKTDWLTQGPAQAQFENAVAAYCGVKYAVTVSSATAALHLAYLALGLGAGDEVWTSPNTFVATANGARYCGAEVDFVDMDDRTYNLSVEKLAEKLAARKSRGGRLPAIITPVHFAGQSCEMEEIQKLAQSCGAAVVEDAAHAIGGAYQGKPVGCCRWSDAAVLSFHAVKIMTTGEGGMVLTNRADLYEKLVRLRSHGITRKAELLQEPSHGPWYYEQLELGHHYRMTDIQAALGASQLKRLDRMVARRREIARSYDKALGDLPLTLPWQHPSTNSSWHLYVIRLQLERIRKTHREVFEGLRAAGIGVNLHYIPVHFQPYYRELGFKAGDYPAAERYYGEAISLPMFSKLTDAELEMVTQAVRTTVTGI